MEILLPNNTFSVDQVRENLFTWKELKFVMIKTHQLVVRLVNMSYSHASEASELIDEYEDAVFVGAGRLGTDLEPFWGSSSCKDEFGYDRPQECADEILSQFNQELKKLLQVKR